MRAIWLRIPETTRPVVPSAQAGVMGNSLLATSGPRPQPIAPPPRQMIADAIAGGVDFLLADQRPDGSWGSPENTKGLNIYAPAPGGHDGFRTAVTSLVLLALVEALPDLDAEQRSCAETAIDRGENWLVEKLRGVRRANGDTLYNVWAHAYAIQALVRLHKRAAPDTSRRDQLKCLVVGQVEMLSRYQFLSGGWGYYDFLARTRRPSGSPNCFVTATALVALHEAGQMDVEMPDDLIEKALESIRRQRKPDFSYVYGEYLRMRPMHPVNRPAGSLGRSQVCNLALRLYGDKRVTDEVMITWLNRLFARNGWLSIGRKRPIPHESHFYVAGYFYYYGHFYAAMCVEHLPPDRQPYFQEHLAHLILPLQETDGSWWDFPFYNYHQQYGTAMAVATLVRCQRREAQSPKDLAVPSRRFTHTRANRLLPTNNTNL